MHNFIIGPTDTDSISFCKEDMSPFSKEEIDFLLKELKSISPEFMDWEDDGYYSRCLALKAKNYVLIDENNKRKIKGAALKDSKSSKQIIQFKKEIIEAILNEQNDKLLEIYHKYVKETSNITDVQSWSKKLTVTEKIFACKGHEQLTKEEKKEKGIRKNESDVYDAIKHKNFQEGDKIYVYYNDTDGLTLADEFNGKYDRDSFLKNLFTSLQIFKLVIDVTPYLNYTLKKNKKLLEEVDNASNI